MPNFTKNIPGPPGQSIKTPNEQPHGSPHEQPNLAPPGPAPAKTVAPPSPANPLQPGEAAPPAESPAGKSGGLGFLKGLIGPKSPASPGAGGFASTAPTANSAGGTWSMGQIIFSPTFPPTISFQSAGGSASKQSAGPSFGAGKKPGQPGKTDSNQAPTGQPAGQPGKTDSNPSPTGQPAGQPDTGASKPDLPSGSPEPDSSDPTQQPGPPPKLPEATPEDIAYFKSASQAHTRYTEEDELAWIRHLKQKKPAIYGHIPDDEPPCGAPLHRE
ncbi:hypothetical protein [Nannocystis pusilla]|uniref:hypothetical protein n=1 Tax=Nannocystis pusilla TaxID=889268 RepID=UPI003DA58F35